MKIQFSKITLALLILLTVAQVGSFPLAEAWPTYTVTDLGPGIAFDINELGQVVGDATAGFAPSYTGFFWDPTSGRQDFSPWSIAYGINDKGEVVGHSYGQDPAFLWDSSTGKIQDLPLFALAINNNTQVGGWGGTGGNLAVIWEPIKGILNVGGGGGFNGVSRDINNLGYSVGDSYATKAFSWNSLTNEINYIFPIAGTNIQGNGINDLGQVVGTTTITLNSTRFHAYLWDSASGTQDLGTVYGWNSIAYAINNNGVVVGRSTPKEGDSSGYGVGGWIAFVWDDRYGMRDLNSLIPANSGWTLGTAFGINDLGQIVGYGRLEGTEWEHAFLLTPTSVPEPTTITVAIDIKPGSYPNSINPKSKGNIPVAILSTQEFCAPEMVNKDSLTFGPTGNEDSLAFCNHRGEDINGDGLLDLVCHFYTEDTAFECVDTQGILKGEILDSIPMEGEDLVKINPCK